MTTATITRPAEDTTTGHCHGHDPEATFTELLRAHAIAERTGDQAGARMFLRRLVRLNDFIEAIDDARRAER